MMKKRTLIMSALAVVLAAGLTIAPAMAYFTAHTEASGRVAIELGDSTNIREEVDVKNMTKTVWIENSGPESVYVRAKAIPGAFEGTPLTLTYDVSGWSGPDEEGWYYYDGILDAEEDTEEGSLVVKISGAEGAETEDEINVTVIYECVKVLYDENGDPLEAKWNLKAETE